MDHNRYICGHCNNSFKHKSSLRRHINNAHNQKRFTCGICNKQYTRKVDYINHITRNHPPLILQQGAENITWDKQTPTATHNVTTTTHPSIAQQKPTYTLEATTSALNSTQDWEKILKNDLALSDDEPEHSSISPPKITMGVNTDKTFPKEATKCTNTSPLGIFNLTSQLVSTHELPEESKGILKIIKKPSTQIGCIPMTIHKNRECQTDDNTCHKCTNSEHLIIQRQQYIINDAVRNCQEGYSEPVTSREDRHKMPLPSTTIYNKWCAKLKPSLIPRSPREFPKPPTPPRFTNPELKITSSTDGATSSSRIRKPTSLTIDNSTYEAICSRKKTRPTLVTSPRKIILPPPPQDGKWSYRTTKF